MRVIIGVGGGIAAYKAPELARRLRDAGAEVRVVPTAAALAFVTPLTLQAASGHPVRSELLRPDEEAGMDHIALARWADRLLIAPATADLIARLALGIANDLLTTLALATEAELWLAPAMNHRMWAHPATVANLELLQARGARRIGPDHGAQACGEVGPGRMAEPAAIVRALTSGSRPQTLAGRRVLMTVGPTREAIDPVRFVGNRSSGKMGFALAAALAARGASVTAICGPVSVAAPAAVELVRVETALEMHRATLARVADCELFVAAAAVADYRPAEPAADKIAKTAAELTLRLVRNPDILADVAALPRRPFTVGFAAETADPRSGGVAKLAAKNVDMIAANQVGGGLGFDVDDNALVVLWPGGSLPLPSMSKTRLADRLADAIAERYAAVA